MLLLLLLMLPPFVQLQMSPEHVNCDVTGYPWHPERECKPLKRDIYPADQGVAFHELITSGTKQFNVTYACPDNPKEPDYIVFCYTEWVNERLGNEQARIEPMGCWQYGWKKNPESRAECENASVLTEDRLQGWPKEPIKLIAPAGKGLIDLANEYVKDYGYAGEPIGYSRTATRRDDFVYDPSWLPTTTTTTTNTTTSPEHVYCDVTGYPWHPEKECKPLMRDIYTNDSGVAFHELVTSGTRQLNVTYACPDSPTAPDYIVFCYTEWVNERPGHEQARIEPMGCYQYGWKNSPESRAECQNASVLIEHYLQGWPKEPIKLIMPAGKGLIALANEYVKDISFAGEPIGFTRTATRRDDFVYDPSWLLTTPATTTTTTTESKHTKPAEPKPTESDDDIRKRQLQLENSDRELYQYLLLVLSFGGALAIVGCGNCCIYCVQKKRSSPDRDQPPLPSNSRPNTSTTTVATPTIQPATPTTNDQIV